MAAQDRDPDAALCESGHSVDHDEVGYIYIFGLHHSPSGLKLAAQLGHLEVARNLVLQQDGIERMYVVQAAVFRPSAWRR